MFSHKILQNFGVILFSILLFGCTPQSTSNTGGFENVTASSSHHKHRRSHSRDALAPDNPASEDYFRNQPVSTGSEENLWIEMKSNFQLEHYPNSPAVKAQIDWFMNNQGYLNRTARRAAPFMYYIYQETKARHLPAELVLLPIIESAYNPFVSSYAGAAGLWQMEPGTGRMFGLRQDFWYDGRKDVSTSTKAALDYLSYLQNFFGGNWLLAIAAYDTGEGNVASSIRRNTRAGLPTDFWSLHLASETQAYIPKLLALSVIISNPKEYGITLPTISNAPYLGEVEVGSQMSLNKAANLAGVSLEEIQTLNAGYKKSTLDPHHPYKLLLPIDRISTFKRNLLSHTENNNTDDTGNLWSRYKVQPGDTWKKIATRFGTTISLLQSVNHSDAFTPPLGQVLLIPETNSNQSAFATAVTQEAQETHIPASTSQTETEPSQSHHDAFGDYSRLPEITTTTPPQENSSDSEITKSKGLHLRKQKHIVKHGETLSSIANMYKISSKELAHWNNIPFHHALKSGETLVIWERDSQNESHHYNSNTIAHSKYHQIHHHSHHKRA
jgi:membrane-bound lytic murein transglycosylase D